MNRKRSLILLLFFTVITLIPLIAWLAEKYDNNHFSCTTHLTYHKNNTVVEINASYTFHSGTGVIDASGVLISADGSKTDISRKFNFDYIKRGSEYTLLSNQTLENKPEIILLRTIVPDFYMLSHRGVTLTIKRQEPNGYIFMMDNVPVYFCERN